MNNLKDYELNTTIPEFQFIIDALQYGVSSEEIQITKIGFDDFLKFRTFIEIRECKYLS